MALGHQRRGGPAAAPARGRNPSFFGVEVAASFSVPCLMQRLIQRKLCPSKQMPKCLSKQMPTAQKEYSKQMLCLHRGVDFTSIRSMALPAFITSK